MARNRILVIGLDGATWDFLNPMIAEGHLPSIARLKQQGISGNLESVVPPCTPVGWKAYSTGTNPGKFGVFYWFSLTELRRGRIDLHDAHSYRSPEIWDILSTFGHRCAVIGMPMTYPPKPINGIMVSGIPALESQPYTYPLALKEQLTPRGFRINPSTPLRLEPGTPRVEAVRTYRRAIEELISLTNLYFDLALECLREDFQFVHLTIQWTDQMLHYTWRLLVDGDAELSAPIRQFWTHLDLRIGHIVASLEPTDYVFLISDHGMALIQRFFHFNNWLEQRGYLVSKKSPLAYRFASSLGLTREGAYTLSQTRVGRLGVKLVPISWLRAFWFRFRTRSGRIGSVESIDRTDWARSRALMVGDGYVYVNVPRFTGPYESLRNELIAAIRDVRDPETEEPVCDAFRVDEIYHGPHVEDFDIIVLPHPGYSLLVPSIEGPHEWTVSFEDHFTADHALTGIFACVGPNAPKGITVSPVRIVDLAPTLLGLLEVPLPPDLDGRAIPVLFPAGAPSHGIGPDSTMLEMAQVRRRIRDLKNQGRL